MKRLVFGALCVLGSANALEFGYMGNTAIGMGGSGVAVANSPFSAYYNPSLLGVDGTIRVGYSLGARLKEHRLDELSQFTLSSINDIAKLNDILANNNVSMASENGVAVQIPLSFGAMVSHSLGVGAFYTKMAAINFTGSLNAGTTDINNAINAYIVTNGLDIIEIPVSYAAQIYSGVGSFYVGASLKYIHASHSHTSTNLTNSAVISDAVSDVFRGSGGTTTNTFGIDIGASYALPGDVFVVGIVGKNLNAPKLNTQASAAFGDENFKLDSQYRLGFSTRAIPLTTLALDIDLKPNEEFRGLNNGMTKQKVQYLTLGGMVNIGFFDVKLGIAKNLRAGSEGWLFSAGLGFTFIDISLFTNTNIVTINSLKMPSEFGIKIGGGFSF